MKAPSRQMIDRIARAVVSGRRGYGEKVDRLADVVAGLMKNRLAAVRVGGAKRGRYNRQTNAALYDRQVLDVLLDRAEKHLAWEALAKEFANK